MLSSAALVLLAPPTAAGHSGELIGEYATATVDGVISPGEYEGSCTEKIYQSSSQSNYELTFCAVNDETNDYWAIRVFDLTADEADNPLIWFDANHDGLVQPGVGGECPFGGPVEDYIGYNHGALIDRWYCNKPDFIQDADGGGSHGAAAAIHEFPDWVFEFSHPLDSPDPDDYSVETGDTLGWCFTYNNASDPTNSTAVGELQYPPNCWFDPNSADDAVQGQTLKYADLLKETLTHDSLEKLKDKLKGLVATCDVCPPDPRAKLREKVNSVINDLKLSDKPGAIGGLKAFIRSTRNLLAAEQLLKRTARRFIEEARLLLGGLRAPPASPGPTVAGPGAHSAFPVEIGEDGKEIPPPRTAAAAFAVLPR